MKIKNIFIASMLALGLTLSFGSNFASAETEQTISFEEFAKDKNKLAKWEKDHTNHIKKVQELRDERRIKRLEYRAFMHNPNAEPSDISKVAKAIVELEREISNLNTEFFELTRDKYHIDLSEFYSYQNNNYGYHHGYRHGHGYHNNCYKNRGRNCIPCNPQYEQQAGSNQETEKNL